MAGEIHGASNEERDRVRCRCCGVRWEEHEPDPDKYPCIRHGIVPLQGMVLRLEAEVAAQKVAIATLQEAAGPRARTAGEIASGATLAERLREDMVAAGVVVQPGGKVLGMDFKEDWLPTPDDAGYYRYADGSFIRPSRVAGGGWIVGGERTGAGWTGAFENPEAAAEHLKALGMGPAAEPERSVADGRREEGQGEGRGAGGPGRGRHEGGAGGGGCPGG